MSAIIFEAIFFPKVQHTIQIVRIPGHLYDLISVIYKHISPIRAKLRMDLSANIYYAFLEPDITYRINSDFPFPVKTYSFSKKKDKYCIFLILTLWPSKWAFK